SLEMAIQRARDARDQRERRMQLLHIRRRQHVRTSRTAEIDPVGRFEDLSAVEIERTEQSGLVPCDVRIDAAQRICIRKEWNLKRLVVSPKAHAMLPGVVASTLIRETEWHSAHRKRFPCLCPGLICVVPGKLIVSIARCDAHHDSLGAPE